MEEDRKRRLKRKFKKECTITTDFFRIVRFNKSPDEVFEWLLNEFENGQRKHNRTTKD